MFLILGGTGRARELATVLAAEGVVAITSLAGRTRAPRELPTPTRIGGFGGPGGLIAWLNEHQPRAVVDATHPDAARISRHAVHACEATGIELCRFEPPSWREHPAADSWIWVPEHEAAARQAAAGGAVLLSVGRQPLSHYLDLREAPVLARVIDPPELKLPSNWRVIEARGPFTLDGERALLAGPPSIRVLVSKDAGGAELEPKLVAAAQVGVQVVMIERPCVPAAPTALADLDGVLAWLRSRG